MDPTGIDTRSRSTMHPDVVAKAKLEAEQSIRTLRRLEELQPQIDRDVQEAMLRPKPTKISVVARFDEQSRHTGYTFTGGNLNELEGERADQLRREIYDRTPSPAHSDPGPEAYAELAQKYPELMEYRRELDTVKRTAA